MTRIHPCFSSGFSKKPNQNTRGSSFPCFFDSQRKKILSLLTSHGLLSHALFIHSKLKLPRTQFNFLSYKSEAKKWIQYRMNKKHNEQNRNNISLSSNALTSNN